MGEVSAEAEVYAVCLWKLMPQATIKATWPENISKERPRCSGRTDRRRAPVPRR